MLYDLSEMKKLSTEEKLQIIDELWSSIDADKANSEEYYEEDPSIVSMLQERLENYKTGKAKSYTWEETKKILRDHLSTSRNEK